MESKNEAIRQYIAQTREETERVRNILLYLEQAQQDAVLRIIDQSSSHNAVQVGFYEVTIANCYLLCQKRTVYLRQCCQFGFFEALFVIFGLFLTLLDFFLFLKKC